VSVTVGVLPGDAPLQGIRGDKWGPIAFTSRTALDLSGRTWLAQIRATKDEPAEIIATFTVDSSDAAAGIIRLTLPPTESAKLVTGTTGGRSTPGSGKYFYDVQATLDSDPTDVKTWFAGSITAKGDVSVGA
jgi:hypothetical protein